MCCHLLISETGGRDAGQSSRHHARMEANVTCKALTDINGDIPGEDLSGTGGVSELCVMHYFVASHL